MRRLIKRLLLNPPNAFDSDAQSYITAAGITNVSHQSAINTYVLGLKSAGLWNKIVARYITYNSATTAAVNMKNPAQFLATIVGSPTINSNGYTGNASSYFRTGIIVNSNLTNNNVFIGVYQKNDLGNQITAGAAVSSTQRLTLSPVLATTTFDCYDNITSSGRTSYSGNIRNSRIIGSRTASNSAAIYSNGASVATISTSGGSIPDIELVFDGFSSGTPGSTTFTPQSLARQYYGFICGQGLTSSEVSTLDTLEATLKTALGL